MFIRNIKSLVKLPVIIFLSFILITGLGYTLFHFYQTFYNIQNIFAKAGMILILFFTTLIILRYFLLLFFSIIKIAINSEKEINKNTSLKVSIIVPAYNEEVVIAKSIESLTQQTYQNLEIIVIDDGSKDKTYSIAKRYENHPKKEIRVFRKKNGGKAMAINYGIERAEGDLIMVVDADSKLDKDAVALMVTHFEDEDIAAVAGSVYVSNQNNLWTKLQALEYLEGLNMVRNGQAFLKLVNIIPGPIGMFRKNALIEVGLYDDDTFAEDCDVTLKLISKGYKIDFEPDAVAYTEAPEELLNLIKQRYRWTRGILQAIRKHKKLLWKWRGNIAASFTMWYMLFEAIFWPFMDLWANMFILYSAMVSGYSILMFYWWVMFTIVDIAGALFCILVTGDKLSLAFYAIYYRLFFIQVINLAKILSTFEEWFGVKMSWGKLDRKGNL
jgi:cellulose synthase/poly-beta-1,6-N-acetylglucosamine synthase-like glycosyltransferase